MYQKLATVTIGDKKQAHWYGKICTNICTFEGGSPQSYQVKLEHELQIPLNPINHIGQKMKT